MIYVNSVGANMPMTILLKYVFSKTFIKAFAYFSDFWAYILPKSKQINK